MTKISTEIPMKDFLPENYKKRFSNKNRKTNVGRLCESCGQPFRYAADFRTIHQFIQLQCSFSKYSQILYGFFSDAAVCGYRQSDLQEMNQIAAVYSRLHWDSKKAAVGLITLKNLDRFLYNFCTIVNRNKVHTHT